MPTHYRTCTLCEAMCGLVIETAGDDVLSIKGDKEDPLGKGHICPKAVALQDIQNDPDRLTKPLRRTASGWDEIGWDEAFDEVAERLREVQRKHGRHSVGVYLGNPTVHNYGSILFGQSFFAALGTKTRYSATSVDQLPHQLAAFLMLGHQLLVPIPDIDRTHYMLILGANPGASNGSLMSAPGTLERLQAIRARGGKVVLVDPRRTETAAAVDRHHFIRPGTDAALLMALLQTIFAEGLDKPGKLAAMTKGMDELRRVVADVTPERAADVIGVSAADIRAIAREFAAAPSAVCYGRFGVSTQEFGGLCHWLLNCLNIVTGNLDREGGAMFTLPAVDVVGLSRRQKGGLRGSYDRRRSRVRGAPEFAGEWPVATLAEEMLTPGEGQVRALITSAGNPVLSTPNGAQLDRALAGLDFMVSVDLYLNETTRHANIILPPTAPLEHDHYDLIFHVLAVRNTTRFSPAVFEPPAGARHDWQIFSELQRRFERDTVANRAKQFAMRKLGPETLVDLGLRAGPYGGRFNPLKGLTLRRVKARPHGIDLGPMKPLLPQRLCTEDQKIDAAPPQFVADVERLHARLLDCDLPAGEFDLRLIGRRQVRSNNSWMHNYERLVKGPNRCTLLMHPDDAAARGLTDGVVVRVASRVGVVEAPLEVTDAMMPGVVSLPHGWGHGRPGVKARIAAAHAGVSLNDLTDDLRLDELAGTAVLNGTPVRVERLES